MINHMLSLPATTVLSCLAAIAANVLCITPSVAAESHARITVTTELGDIQADARLVESGQLLPAASELLTHLTAADPADYVGLEVMIGPFGTVMARSERCLITSQGLLHAEADPEATSEVPVVLPDDLPAALRRSLNEIIAITDGEAEAANPDERAAFERILAHDGLAPLAEEFPSIRPTLDALAARYQPHAIAAWRNDREQITLSSADDTDSSRWIWTSTTTDQLQVSQRARLTDRLRSIADSCRLVSTWSRDGNDLKSAVFLQHGKRILSWDGVGHFEVDHDAWVALCAAAHRLAIPPHLLVLDADGAVTALITEAGAIAIPQDVQETDVFLNRLAEVLTTPAELDLIGTALFDYVSDSPDSTRPWLIGTEHHHGDEHQTAHESLARAAGGIIHGDCDDLAELFHQVLSRQHRNPIMLSLPAHAATAWATKTDQGWSMDVLHTGRPVHAEEADVPTALAKVLADFSDGSPVDANQVSLLLRFADENRRTHWRLGWRIFSEPDYAETMINIQRCWHFRVYGTAIRLTKGLLDGGDLDLANFSELAGLYRRTSQWDLAIAEMGKTIERIEEPEPLLLRQMELLYFLIRGQRFAEADALATKLGDAIVAQWGARHVMQQITMLSRLTAPLDGRHQSDTIALLMERHLISIAERVQGQIGQHLLSNPGAKIDLSDRDLRPFAQMMRAVSTAITDLGYGHDGDPASANPLLRRLLAVHQPFVDIVRFRSPESDELSSLYSQLGVMYELLFGRQRVAQWIAEAQLPTAPVDHRQRPSGAAGLAWDLPWIAASPSWWNLQLDRATNPNEDPDHPSDPDLDGMRSALNQINATSAAAEQRGIAGRRDANLVANNQLLFAIVNHDEAAARSAVRALAAQRDRAARESAANRIGAFARFCDEQWFATLLAIYDEEIGAKPYYLEIAWEAARSKAGDRALQAARFAAQRFPDDEEITSEEQHLASVLERNRERETAAAQE